MAPTMDNKKFKMEFGLMTQKTIEVSTQDYWVTGLGRCPKCKFVLVSQSLNMGDGTVAGKDSTGETCPNDGMMLWRITWKQHAQELAKDNEAIHMRLIEVKELLARPFESQDRR